MPVPFSSPRREWPAALWLLAACLCLGGARHHLHWSVIAADDISLFATEQPRPVRLTATVAREPWVRVREVDALRSAWAQVDDTICIIECRSLTDGDQNIPVSGRARLTVGGHLLHVQVGDEIEVQGWLVRPRDPGNPGEYNFRDHLRRERVHCLVRAQYPDAVRRLRDGESQWFRRGLVRLRSEAERLFALHLDERNAPIASALFLGNRSSMPDDVRRAFAESGMMHVLAISGLHVGILAGFLWVGCRILNIGPRATSAVVLGVIVGYALLTSGRPPVVRATVFVVLAAAGRPWFRQAPLENILALAALVVLAWNPTDLFDAGAQLSFLAVAAILWSGGALSERDGPTAPIPEKGTLRRLLEELAKWLGRGYLVVAAIWLCTVPLVAARFHLISPVGLLINVLLLPVVTLVLGLGYLLLACGLLIPAAVPAVGFALDRTLAALLFVVESASRIELGHLYVPGPPAWWLIGFYALLCAAITLPSFPRRPDSGASNPPRPPLVKGGSCVQFFAAARWHVLTTWIIVGLLVGLVPARPDGLRCTFLAVGHGGAILIELPNGSTLLYDAGSIQDADRATRIIQGALWERRLSRIDAAVPSHADVDHFNALPGLIRTVPVGCVLIAQSFLDFEQEAVVELCKTARQEGVPLRIVWEGDRLRMDDRVSLSILHPAARYRSEHDNANSVVLLVEYAGRRILLTGDLERDGLQDFLAKPSLNVDVMLAPHHGSPNANPPALAEWARPACVVASSGRGSHLPHLRAVYGPDAQVFATADSGAVVIDITPQGALHIRETRRSPPE